MTYLNHTMNEGMGRNVFSQFMKYYLFSVSQVGAEITKRSMNSTDFQDSYNYFIDNTDYYTKEQGEKVKAAVDWNTWINEPGTAPQGQELFSYDSDMIKEAKELADAYVKLKGLGSPFNLKGFFKWNLQQ